MGGTRSQKTKVIEHLFFKYWDTQTASLTKSVMSFDEVIDAIRFCNETHGSKLSTKNPANFMKDVVRGKTASDNWPPKITALRFTAIQVPGDGNVFEFIPFLATQTEPFPDDFPIKPETRRIEIQSVSLPLAAKELGRSDEPWLIQTAINLRVIETHFALMSALNVVQLDHLQMSVKLRSTEIDAIFLATCKDGKDLSKVFITCEAKQARERLLQHQIVQQVKSAFHRPEVETVVALGIRAVRKEGIQVVEFLPIKRGEIPTLEKLTLATEAIYQLKPPVKGI